MDGGMADTACYTQTVPSAKGRGEGRGSSFDPYLLLVISTMLDGSMDGSKRLEDSYEYMSYELDRSSCRGFGFLTADALITVYSGSASRASRNSIPSALPIRPSAKASFSPHSTVTSPGCPMRPQRPAACR